MNLGMVGVGPWGRTIAASFKRAGSAVIAYDRSDKNKKMNDMGELMAWPDMVESSFVEILACAGPPDVTMQVFKACQARRKPCFLTKPFLISEVPRDLSAPVYVDFVNLASPVYERFKKNATRDYKIESLKVSFYGSGPERNFSGFVDYGSHALAFVHDLLGLKSLEDIRAGEAKSENAGDKRELIEAQAKMKNIKVDLYAGNGASGSKRRVEAQLARGPRVSFQELNRVATFEINDKAAMTLQTHDPLSIMVERFLWDVEVGRVNPYFVELSAAVTRSLEKIQLSL